MLGLCCLVMGAFKVCFDAVIMLYDYTYTHCAFWCTLSTAEFALEEGHGEKRWTRHWPPGHLSCQHHTKQMILFIFFLQWQQRALKHCSHFASSGSFTWVKHWQLLYEQTIYKKLNWFAFPAVAWMQTMFPVCMDLICMLTWACLNHQGRLLQRSLSLDLASLLQTDNFLWLWIILHYGLGTVLRMNYYF